MSPVQWNGGLAGVKGPAGVQPQRQSVQGGKGFADALHAEVAKQSEVKLSAHAQKRLAEHNVEFGASEQARLSAAVDKIESKGADKSLVLMDNLALLVSARNRTVITAVDSTSAKDGVFTGIDSAMII